MDKQLENELQAIASNVNKLKTRTRRLETENEELRKSVFGYLQQLEDQQKEAKRLAELMKHGQISESLPTDKKLLQKEIDKYLQMIDKCIASVNAKM